MIMQDEFTDRLSDYLDDELSANERQSVDRHLRECEACRRTLDELTRVVASARALPPRPPSTDLWSGIAARMNTPQPAHRMRAWRISFTLPQLAAASLLLAALSGGLVWFAARPEPVGSANVQARQETAVLVASPETDPAENVQLAPIALADNQYAAAVADLERALAKGRGRLDRATIAIVEQNLKTIDQAIAQARQALAADPANTYLSGHLVETRRRKLDLLRRAAALTTDAN